jgi:hypothetical protein
MSVVLLRTLTRKSILGFGKYVDITVQNMLDTFLSKELLNIYYTCRNIDLNQDLKDELCIHGEREINKKEKQDERYIPKTFFYISECIKEMSEKKTEAQEKMLLGYRRKEKIFKKKQLRGIEGALSRTIFSKGAQRDKNQNTY